MKLSMLNMMAGSDFSEALDRHVHLEIDLLDLKDHILGRKVEDLTSAETERVGAMIRARGLSVYCISSQLGYRPIELGEAQWIKEADDCLARVLDVARTLHAKVVRVLCASTAIRRASIEDLHDDEPWLLPAYTQIVKNIYAAGFRPMVENEAHNCIVASPIDAVSFTKAIRGQTNLGFIWDVQNMWQMGSFPIPAHVDVLLPVLAGLHLKGGIADNEGNLEWASELERASWPVIDIVRAVIGTGQVDVICLNPSHGQRRSDFTVLGTAEADIRFLRNNFPALSRRP